MHRTRLYGESIVRFAFPPWISLFARILHRLKVLPGLEHLRVHPSALRLFACALA